MKAKLLVPALLMLVAIVPTQAQNEYDEQMLSDADPFLPQEDEPIEGSGVGVLEFPVETTPETEIIQDFNEMELTTETAVTENYSCPGVCTCNTEVDGESFKYVVDCSGKNIEEFPANIDYRATELNLQNNKLIIIPKTVSQLKMLQILNLNDNTITDLAAGSISELPELKTLKLANNRLLEYPQELKNGFSLVKLEEIDLGGNDIRSTFTVDNFAGFVALRMLVLPTSDKDFVEVLCNKMKNTLETVCVGSCRDWANDCPDAPEQIDADFMDGKLPGTLTSSLLDVAPIEGVVEDNIKGENKNSNTVFNGLETTESSNAAEVTTDSTEKGSADFSLRTAVVDTISQNSGVIKENEIINNTSGLEGNVKVGATTSNTNTGAVDKSIIGMIVAGMVLIVAGITIKKNWGSLKKRFSSSSAPERSGVNGTTPEEVPLQEKDKSPV